jgi:hypothetical protein
VEILYRQRRSVGLDRQQNGMNTFLKDQIVRKLFSVGGGGGSSAPAYPIKAIKKLTKQNTKATKKDGKALIGQVDNIAADLENKITAQADAFGRTVNDEEQKVLDRVRAIANELNAGQAELDDKLSAKINEALGEFNSAMSLLDETDRAEFLSEVNSFRTNVEQIDAALRSEVTDALDQFDSESTAAIGDFDARTAGLGDTFMESARGFMDEYRGFMDEAGDLSPERLSKFTQAADFLSQAAVKTRADMLATADPRALELSQIADNNAAAMMSGQIGADMQANLARSSAMRALQGGFGAGSEMGRGLAARDLGLTSLDLQRQGFDQYERQRSLNFNTRVAGLQADSGQLLANDQMRLERAGGSLLESGLRTAESDRNFRGDAANRILGGSLAVQDTLRGDRIGLANQSYAGRMGTEGNIFANSVTNLGNRTSRREAGIRTNLASNSGLAEQIYLNNTGNIRQNATTFANTAGGIYDTNINAANTMAGMNIRAAESLAEARANTRGNVFTTVANARNQGTNNLINAYNNKYVEDVKRAQEKNSGLGALMGVGGSVIGGAIGGVALGAVSGGALAPMGIALGSSLGGMGGAAAAGGLGPGGYAGGAQGANMGSSMMGFLGGGLGGFTGGGFTSMGAAQSAAPYASSFRSNYGMGYVPVAGRA